MQNNRKVDEGVVSVDLILFWASQVQKVHLEVEAISEASVWVVSRRLGRLGFVGEWPRRVYKQNTKGSFAIVF